MLKNKKYIILACLPCIVLTTSLRGMEKQKSQELKSSQQNILETSLKKQPAVLTKEQETIKKALEKFIEQHSENKNITICLLNNPIGKPYYDAFTKTVGIPPAAYNTLIKTKDLALSGILLHEIGHANDPQLTSNNLFLYKELIEGLSGLSGLVIGSTVSLKLYKRSPYFKKHPKLAMVFGAGLSFFFELAGEFTGKFVGTQVFSKKREIFADQYAAQNCITREDGLALIEFLNKRASREPSWFKYFDRLFIGHPKAETRIQIIKKILDQRTFPSSPTQKSVWNYIEEEFAANNEPLPWATQEENNKK